MPSSPAENYYEMICAGEITFSKQTIRELPDQNGDGKADRLVRETMEGPVEANTLGLQCTIQKTENEEVCRYTREVVEYRQPDGTFKPEDPNFSIGRPVTYRGSQYTIFAASGQDLWVDGRNANNSSLILQKEGETTINGALLVSKQDVSLFPLCEEGTTISTETYVGEAFLPTD